MRHRAAHVEDGARPADDLLRRGRRAAIEVGEPPAPLLGEPGQGEEPVADGVSRGLGAGGDEQHEERADFLGRHGLAVDLGVDEDGRQVVLRMLEPVLAEPEAVLAELLSGSLERRAAVCVLGVSGGEESPGEVEHARPIGLRHADHVADDVHGKDGGDLGDEVDLALGGDGVDDRPGTEPHRFLGAGDHARGEAAVDHASELGVLRRVRHDHRPDFRETLEVVHHLDAVGGAERLPVAGGDGDILVAGQGPEALAGVGVLVPRYGALAAKLGEGPVEIVAQPEVEAGGVDLVQLEAGGRGLHVTHGHPL